MKEEKQILNRETEIEEWKEKSEIDKPEAVFAQ